MNLQIIKSVDGRNEYVLLPFRIYSLMRDVIEDKIKAAKHESDYAPFDPADYVDNPVALDRIKTGMTQEQLAVRMKVTQAYISKIERQEKVTVKLLSKVKTALIKKH